MHTRHGTGGAVASADALATAAGVAILRHGGNAVDAAIATNAAIAVTGPHLCGMGGDLFALVHHDGAVACLNASGRAASGADGDALRRAGHTEVPLRHEIGAVTVPGCVDGWVALHARFGSMPLADVLAPAIGLARGGFPASALLTRSLQMVDAQGTQHLAELATQATETGATVCRPGVARTLRAIAEGGRAAFYEGEFGAGLRALAPAVFAAADLARSQADWVTPLRSPAWGVELWTVPPNSQGYLLLGAAGLAERIGLPDDPDDAEWAHLLIECAIAAGYDRPAVLHEGVDGQALLGEVLVRQSSISRTAASRRAHPAGDGDTTYLCAADARGMVVSLIQSNASGFGSWIVEPSTGINLHNRGLGFSLQPGHPAEMRPGARPPHTLSPALATGPSGLVAALGTMGGDAQPQILLQIAARLFHHGAEPGQAITAGRWALHGPATGFDTWTAPQGPGVLLEGTTPPAWDGALSALGHRVRRVGPLDSGFGHAHTIVRHPGGDLAAAADPRTLIGAAEAW